MDKIIYHVDVNSAFLSWEASYRVNILGESLDLRDIPSVIGGSEKNRHGIVLAKSIPSKKYNIQTGEPLVSVRQKCPNIVIVPPNYPMYVEASKALMELLREYSPDIHQYSIDESFVDMSGTIDLYGSPVIAAHMIKDRIKRELGFTVNIGVSSNKLLAKMASDFKKPDRVHTLFPEEIEKKMWPLPVSDLFYVGYSSEKKLLSMGIQTIGELAQCDPMRLYQRLKSHGLLIWQFANGIDDQMDKMTLKPVNKGYGNSVTSPFDIKDAETARLVMLSLTETVCARMRADNAYVSVVAISIVDHDFNHSTKQHNLLSPTDITIQIYNEACKIFEELWDHVTPIRQLGVHTSKASNTPMYQYSLFDKHDLDKEIKLDKAVDEIRNRWGEDAIMRGSFISNKNGNISHMAGGLDKARRTGMTKALE